MKSSGKLQQYKFRDSQQFIYATISGNIILGILLMFPDFTQVWQNPHIRWCLFSALALVLLKVWYNWKSPVLNVGILLVYLLGVLLEYLQAGLPGEGVTRVAEHRVSKGIMMEMLIAMLPAFYLALRAFLGLGLVWVIRSSRVIAESNNS